MLLERNRSPVNDVNTPILRKPFDLYFTGDELQYCCSCATASRKEWWTYHDCQGTVGTGQKSSLGLQMLALSEGVCGRSLTIDQLVQRDFAYSLNLRSPCHRRHANRLDRPRTGNGRKSMLDRQIMEKIWNMTSIVASVSYMQTDMGLAGKQDM